MQALMIWPPLNWAMLRQNISNLAMISHDQSELKVIAAIGKVLWGWTHETDTNL